MPCLLAMFSLQPFGVKLPIHAASHQVIEGHWHRLCDVLGVMVGPLVVGAVPVEPAACAGLLSGVFQRLSSHRPLTRPFSLGLQPSSQKDYVILAARTPPRQDPPQHVSLPATRDAVDEEWVAAHACQVSLCEGTAYFFSSAHSLYSFSESFPLCPW